MRVFLGLLAVAAAITYAAWQSSATPTVQAAPTATVLRVLTATVVVPTPKPAATATPLPFPAVGQEALLIDRAMPGKLSLVPDLQMLVPVLDAAQRNNISDGVVALIRAHAATVANGSRVRILDVAMLGRWHVARVQVTGTQTSGWVITQWLEQPVIDPESLARAAELR